MTLSSRLGLAVLGMAIAVFPASAEVRLVDSAPAAAATASKVDKIALRFSEPIAPASLAVDLTMTGMPGMAHHNPMKVTGFATALTPDAGAATLTLPRALPVGTYQVSWHATSAKGGAAMGSYAFSVR